jgi:hypothetical protein
MGNETKVNQTVWCVDRPLLGKDGEMSVWLNEKQLTQRVEEIGGVVGVDRARVICQDFDEKWLKMVDANGNRVWRMVKLIHGGVTRRLSGYEDPAEPREIDVEADAANAVIAQKREELMRQRDELKVSLVDKLIRQKTLLQCWIDGWSDAKSVMYSYLLNQKVQDAYSSPDTDVVLNVKFECDGIADIYKEVGGCRVEMMLHDEINVLRWLLGDGDADKAFSAE